MSYSRSVLLWLQRFIAVQIFVLGLFIFVSSGLPTIANTSDEGKYSFFNKSYASFALSLFPDGYSEFLIVNSPEKKQLEQNEITPTPQPIEPSYCLSVPIIMYHHIQPYDVAIKKGQEKLTVDPNFFEMHMAYIQSAGYTPLTVDNLVTALQNQQPLPQKSIIITLDDGYDDNYIYAYPILKKYNLVANFMIPAGLMETPEYLTWAQISEMMSTGQKMYNHTWSHAPLGYISKQQIIDEVSNADTKLEELTGTPQTILTYPYGSFNDLAIQTLQELGFTAGLTTNYGRSQCDNNLMTLYREHVGNAPLSSYGL